MPAPPSNPNSPPSFIPSVASAYDEPTGALIQQVVNPYTGTPPTTSEYNLTTDYQVDDLGRTVQTLGPSFNSNGQTVRSAAWTIYDDVNQQQRSASGFVSGSNNGPLYNMTLVNPVSIVQLDLAGRITDQISAVRGSTAGPLSPGDQFPQSSWVRWTNNNFDNAGNLTATRVYKLILPDCAGLPGTNYDETDFGYDRMGRQNKTRSPGGTITRTVFNVCNNPVSSWVGTSDVGATDEAPDGFSAPGNNMVMVQSNEYDNGNPVGGNQLLTTQILYVDSSGLNDRETDFAYDFRNRLIATTAYIVRTSLSIVTVPTYDNLDRVIQLDQYQNDPTIPSNLIGRVQSNFDNLGRAYQTLFYAVQVGVGTPYSPQTSNTWFNANDQVVKSLPAGSQAYTKTQYDQVKRISGTFTGYSEGSDNPWTIGSADHLLEQKLSAHDAASNTIQTTFFQRNQGATSATGVLTTSNARVIYLGMWYDGVTRPIATANFGTNSFDRTMVTSPPVSTATVLVSSTAYNERGEAFQTTDPTGMVTQTTFDDAGRWIERIQNFLEGESTGSDANITVEQTYSPDGKVATLTAVNPETGPQTTTYLYGTTLATSDVARSDLLVSEIYPAAADGTDQVNYTYNRQNQFKQKVDQNGTGHQYAFDGLGRQTSDVVATVGSGVDGSVLRIDTAYEIRGMVSQVTSYSDTAGTIPVNQVTLTYNDFGQLINDAQNHSGSGGSPPSVGYGYANGSANTIRPTSITYPNARVLNINYASGEDNSLSRVTNLQFSGDANPAVAYLYFGLNSFATVTYPQPVASSTLASGGSYPGFDLFNRIASLPWTKTMPGDLVQLGYGYNLASNRLYRQDVKAGTGNEQDQIFAYDAVQRLLLFRQGALSIADATYRLTSLVFAQNWGLDPTGNWAEFSQFDQSDSSNGLEQQRTANPFNEITGILATVGANWVTPNYDRHGNTTIFPSQVNLLPGLAGVYDAWNRLVNIISEPSVYASAEYEYDGLNRRIIQFTNTSSGIFVEARDVYYSAQWQALEERVNYSALAERQYVWGQRYVDDCVLRDRDTTGGGSFNERLYALQDANWNVVALCDITGAVQERYAYTPYGVATVYDPSWSVRSSSSFVWQYLFQGGRFEVLTGLYNFRNRDYLPVLGCWIELDPIGYGGQDLSLRNFEGNSPANVTDSNGTAPPAFYKGGTLSDFSPNSSQPELLPMPRDVTTPTPKFQKGQTVKHKLNPNQELQVLKVDGDDVTVRMFQDGKYTTQTFDSSELYQPFPQTINDKTVEFQPLDGGTFRRPEPKSSAPPPTTPPKSKGPDSSVDSAPPLATPQPLPPSTMSKQGSYRNDPAKASDRNKPNPAGYIPPQGGPRPPSPEK